MTPDRISPETQVLRVGGLELGDDQLAVVNQPASVVANNLPDANDDAISIGNPRPASTCADHYCGDSQINPVGTSLAKGEA